MQCELSFAFIALDIVVCNPQTRAAGPERPWKMAQWVEEAIIYDLVEKREGKIREE